jgi:hypothetical protein
MSYKVVVLNSIDRIKEDTTFDYTFNFGDKRDDRRGVLYKAVNNVTEFHIEYIVIPNLFINVKEVHAVQQLGMLPFKNEDLNHSNFSFPKLSDLKYINVHVNELNGNVIGSSNKKSSSMFIIDNIIPKSSTASLVKNYYLDESVIKVHKRTGLKNKGESIMDEPHTYLVLKNVSSEPTLFKKNILSSINLKFYKPNGESIKLLNDKLTIKNVFSTAVSPFVQSVYLDDGTEVISAGERVLNSTVSGFETDSRYLREGLFMAPRLFSAHLDKNPINVFIKETTSIPGDVLGEFYTARYNRLLVNDDDLPPQPTDAYDPLGENNLEFQSKLIEITCNEYFSCEEYKIGDTIHFKDIAIPESPGDYNKYPQLTKFLSRDEGHTIIGLSRDPGHHRRPYAFYQTTLYNIIQILPKTTMDLTQGFEDVDFFGLQELRRVSNPDFYCGNNNNDHECINIERDLSGYILNDDLQNLVSINVKNN